jgi:RNA polymerase-binding transcription factor DksA
MPAIVHADVGTRIERDLDVALVRLRQLGGAVVVMERPGSVGESSAFPDEVDQSQATASREVGLVTREMLLTRVNRLSAALERLNEGEYGVCVECAEPIAPARLAALPEVQTCVRCQAGLERLGRQPDWSRRSVFEGGEDGSVSETVPASYRSSLFPNEEDRDALR